MYLNDSMRTKIVNGSDLFNLTEVPPGYLMDSAVKTFMATWLALVGTVGIVGNGFTIALTMSESRKLLKEGLINVLNPRRRLVCYFIFNLAISDILASLIGVQRLGLQALPNTTAVFSRCHNKSAYCSKHRAILLGISPHGAPFQCGKNLELKNKKYTRVCWYSNTKQVDKAFFFIFVVSRYVIPTIVMSLQHAWRVLIALNSIGTVGNDNHESNTGTAEQPNQNNSGASTDETIRVQIDKRKINILLLTNINGFYVLSHNFRNQCSSEYASKRDTVSTNKIYSATNCLQFILHNCSYQPCSVLYTVEDQEFEGVTCRLPDGLAGGITHN